MHKDVIEFVQKAIADLSIDTNCRVLEIGSRNWNGTPRHLFTGEYIGIDITPGDGVDMVMDGSDLKFSSDSFDVVLCLEVFEHTNKKDIIMREIVRVLDDGGIGIITAAAPGRPIHDGGTDFYENVSYDWLHSWLSPFDTYHVEIGNNEAGTPDIRGYFVK